MYTYTQLYVSVCSSSISSESHICFFFWVFFSRIELLLCHASEGLLSYWRLQEFKDGIEDDRITISSWQLYQSHKCYVKLRPDRYRESFVDNIFTHTLMGIWFIVRFCQSWRIGGIYHFLKNHIFIFKQTKFIMPFHHLSRP